MTIEERSGFPQPRGDLLADRLRQGVEPGLIGSHRQGLCQTLLEQPRQFSGAIKRGKETPHITGQETVSAVLVW